MDKLYKGYGASYNGHESNTKSAIKLQLTYDYLNQVINKLDLTEGIRSDQGYRDYLNYISPNDLLVADLGYFVPNSFKQIHESKAYFISRYKSDTNIYDIITGQKLELLEILDNQLFVEREVILGKSTQVKVRMICQKLTTELSECRRRKANKLARSHGLIRIFYIILQFANRVWTNDCVNFS